jgi:N-dimethylarginine dimethylaminohydrolase
MAMSRRDALKAILPLGVAVRSAGAEVSSAVDRIPVGVRDEFGRLGSVLVHDAWNASDVTLQDIERHPPEILAEHPETRLVERERIIEQHHRFRDLLDRAGVRMRFPDPLDDAPGQVFTRDPCFVIDDALYLGVPRDPHRRHEPLGLMSLCRRVGRVVDLHRGEACIEGGDIIVLDRPRTVLVGTHRHTNEAGVRALTAGLPAGKYRVVTVPHRALHLDCCLAPLPDGDALYVPGKIPPASLEILREFFPRLDPLDRHEALSHLAANLFWIDPETVVSNIMAPATNRELKKRGFRVLPIEFSHLTGMWGSFRCVTCPLVRAT